MLQFIGPMVVPLAPFFQSYGVNLPSSLSTIISRLSTLIPAHLWRPKYGYIATARRDGPRELSGPRSKTTIATKIYIIRRAHLEPAAENGLVQSQAATAHKAPRPKSGRADWRKPTCPRIVWRACTPNLEE